MLPGTRFVNEYGSKFFDVYHVVSSTPKSLTLIKATLFEGDIYTDGNKLMDKVINARATNTVLHTVLMSTTPRRYMLKKDDKGDYFVHGLGTARRRIRLNGTYPVTYIAHAVSGNARQALALPSNKKEASRKRALGA